MSDTLIVGSDGMGSWTKDFLSPLLSRTFPHTTILYDNSRKPDLVVRSHFLNMETREPYDCPYIVWSGESRPVALLPERAPLFELNTYTCDRPNSVFFPHLVAELRETKRPPVIKPKRYCVSYAFSNRIPIREAFFTYMRSLEPSCYSFGRSCPTPDRPFEMPASNRSQNATAFSEFAFNVAMENAAIPGYLTEKIGFAFCAGSVPIYWGDTDTVTSFFNPASFLNIKNFPTVQRAATTALQIWKDPQKLRPYLDAPITLNSRLADYEAIYTEYRPWQKPMVDRLREALPDFS